MKKATTLLTILFMMILGTSFSQDTNEPGKNQIKPALLIIDIQHDFMEMIPEQDKEIGLMYINGLIELFRAHGYPIINIYHHGKEYGPQPGTEGFEFPGSVLIKPEDPRVIKTYADAFNKTELDKVIKESGSNTLFLCGLSAVGCVLATYVGAQNHDYQAFLVKNAIMSHNSDYTDNVEIMFDAVSYDVVKLVLESAEK